LDYNNNNAIYLFFNYFYFLFDFNENKPNLLSPALSVVYVPTLHCGMKSENVCKYSPFTASLHFIFSLSFFLSLSLLFVCVKLFVMCASGFKRLARIMTVYYYYTLMCLYIVCIMLYTRISIWAIILMRRIYL
jgi:hypothetical protein